MFNKISLIIITLVLLASLAACGTINPSNSNSAEASNGSQNGTTTPITGTVEADNYQMLPEMSDKMAQIKLDASADGTTQQLKVGEVMAITLESNPSTGYAWYPSIADTNVLMQMGEPQFNEPTSSSTPIVGAAGTQTFLFQAVETGSTLITLEYKRGWETGVAPDKVIKVTVEVQ